MELLVTGGYTRVGWESWGEGWTEKAEGRGGRSKRPRHIQRCCSEWVDAVVCCFCSENVRNKRLHLLGLGRRVGARAG